MSNQVIRKDPIHDNYYAPLELADRASDWLFYLGVILSALVLVLDKEKHDEIYQWLQIAFAASAVAYFLIGLGVHMHFFPRAENARREEFLSNAFGVELTHERTELYYNNSETEPYKRLAYCVLENTFFSKRVVQKMALHERLKFGLFLFVFFVAVSHRGVSIDWVVVSAQALFSEAVFSKWVRLEWLRFRVEQIYQSTRRLIQNESNGGNFRVFAIEAYGEYETVKATSSILLSGKLFKELNPSLSEEWARIKQGLSA